MKRYIVYNLNKTILRTGGCPDSCFFLQAHVGEFVMEGVANDTTQKIEFDDLDTKDRPINPRVIDKTPAEIIADNPVPVPVPFEKRLANITNKQWQDVQDRITALEG